MIVGGGGTRVGEEDQQGNSDEWGRDRRMNGKEGGWEKGGSESV